MNPISDWPTPVPTGKPPLIELFKLTKRFGAFTALENVSLRLEPGTLHALLGENGAGKSTLVKALLGYHRADEGSVMVDGKEVAMTHPTVAHSLGIGMVYQHFTLVPNLTIAENLVLSRDQLPVIIDWKRERVTLDGFMATMPFKLDLDRPVAALAAGEKQKVEILKQLYLGRKVVVLDEPTSVLTQQEADEVLSLIRSRVVAGELSVLMISHKFREVMAYADEVTILRKGKWVGAGKVAEMTPQMMADQMMGGGSTTASAERNALPPGPVRFSTEGISADDDVGVPAVAGVSLEVRAGEIVGIAGVSGNGQKQLVEVISGQRRANAGRMLVDGKTYVPLRAAMRAAGVHLLPEEPLRNACIGGMSVAANLSLRDFDRPPYVGWKWFISWQAITGRARELIERYGIRTPGADAPISSLSGGNVQRTVLAREVDGTAKVLIVANPCFGLDFTAVAQVRRRIMEARNGGAAVLLVSEDLDELFELSDRLLVMAGGHMVHATVPAQATPAELGKYMAGHA
jgi:general nucleoside transport system ATP-binding protein